MSHYHQLYTPRDSAIVFIDHQPQMTFGVASIDRATMINNVTLLAKAAKEFGVPAVLTAVETESFSGYIWPQLLDVFPGQPVVERTSMNAWDDAGFRAAVEATGKKNILMTGLWTEVCVTWPTIEMLDAGLQHLRRRGLLRRDLSRRAGRRALAHGASGSGAADDHRRLARMAARLGQARALQRLDGPAQTTGRCVWQRRRIRLHHGSSRPAIGANTAGCAGESGALNQLANKSHERSIQ